MLKSILVTPKKNKPETREMDFIFAYYLFCEFTVRTTLAAVNIHKYYCN